MMDIIPGLLTENEFRYFTARTYEALLNVTDDVIASYLLEYLENQNADKKILEMMEACCGSTVRSLTFHRIIRERGILETISKLSPEAVAMSGEDYSEVYKQLKFLEDNRRLLLSRVPKRSLEDFQTFQLEVTLLIDRMSRAGVVPTYSDVLQRLDSNRFLFYTPTDKGHSTYASIVTTRENTWVMVLRGIEYRNYCDEHSVEMSRRAVF